MIKYVGMTLRALFAASVAFLSSLLTALQGDAGLGDITNAQWITAILATIIAFGGTYGITNKKYE